MKFLHISDLHIGKYVNGYRMLDDQRYMLERIVEIIKEKNPDALLIAGDIYDTPPKKSTSKFLLLPELAIRKSSACFPVS